MLLPFLPHTPLAPFPSPPTPPLSPPTPPLSPPTPPPSPPSPPSLQSVSKLERSESRLSELLKYCTAGRAAAETRLSEATTRYRDIELRLLQQHDPAGAVAKHVSDMIAAARAEVSVATVIAVNAV